MIAQFATFGAVWETCAGCGQVLENTRENETGVCDACAGVWK